eukprot:scaffold677387_cov64-Prasinocladus_malaysianus.AAC.1
MSWILGICGSACCQQWPRSPRGVLTLPPQGLDLINHMSLSLRTCQPMAICSPSQLRLSLVMNSFPDNTGAADTGRVAGRGDGRQRD